MYPELETALEQRLQQATSVRMAPGLPEKIFGTNDNATLAEYTLAIHLREYKYRFKTEVLESLNAFMISELGYHIIVLNQDLNPSQRLATIFHLIGHQIKGHIDPSRLQLRLEPTSRGILTTDELSQEQDADEWARDFINSRLSPVFNSENPIAKGLVEASEHLI